METGDQPARGRILKMRLGVNPNSSGHGVLLGAAATLPIAFLTYRAASNPVVVLLTKRCPKPCLWGFVLGVFTVAVFGGLRSLTYQMWGATLLYAYATPLAFVLTASAARAAGIISKANLAMACAAYVVVGLVLVFPALPISTTAYNPVGVFFPFWGLGGPWAAAMWSLARLSRREGPTGTL
ncbi:MAG TPA: hypothetical protein GXX23_05875 [Firmicutes bacterium]|nr:hypothetical protein [Candidatus Fermentithermobacillaceae bacterium]